MRDLLYIRYDTSKNQIFRRTHFNLICLTEDVNGHGQNPFTYSITAGSILEGIAYQASNSGCGISPTGHTTDGLTECDNSVFCPKI